YRFSGYVRIPLQPMLADIEEHPHTSKVRIPNITAVTSA
ncbi:MAG: hypothetical protein EZS28_048390, partial [Streblomastix strix]